MKKIILCLGIFILFQTFSLASNAKDEFSALKANYKSVLLFEGEEDLINALTALPYEQYFSDQMVVELLDRYPIEDELVNIYISEIKDDGSWDDIDYQSTARSGWRPKIHVERVLLLSRAYANKNHSYYQSSLVENTIHKALKFWFDAKLVCPNWWYNQIGVPKTLGAAVILFEERLTEEEKAGAITILNNSKFGMTGQNKVWLAGNVLVKALLENDYEMVKKAQEQIFSEIKIGEGANEGVKSDWSFHQHGAQQQFGNYGAAFLATTSFWAKVFSDTPLAVDQEKLDLLHQLIIEGYQRSIWKGYLDVNGLGRQFYKQAQKHKAFSVMFSSKMLASIDVQNKASYEKLIKENVFETQYDAGKTGLYHYWLSDQTVNRTDKWMTSLKMSSKRVIGAEGGNGDNKQGYYISDGALYTYIDGDEYYNIGAVWDWRKVPGTTVYQTNLPMKDLKWLGSNNQADFVGNVSEGNYGMTAMDLDRDRLMAKKVWVFTPEYTFCLGTAISTDSVCDVSTTIEQNLLKDQLFCLKNDVWQEVENSDVSEVNLQRYHHNRTGYIVFGGTTTAKIEEQRGSWFDVMNTYPNIAEEVESKKVVTIYQEHGMKPQSAKYQYIILPNVKKKEVQSFDENNIKVLANEEHLQAIDLMKDKKIFVAAYAPLNTTLRREISVKTSEACLLMVDYKAKKPKLIVSDPTHKLNQLTITLNGKDEIVKLPTGEYRGTSVEVSL